MKPIVLGYYPDWYDELPPSKLDLSLYTHIAFAFAAVGRDGKLKAADPEKGKELVRRCRAAKVKTILSLGGADSNTTLVAATATPDAVRTLADRLGEMVANAGYDGLDVDWEAPGNPDEQTRMNALVKALRERMPKAILTMATPATDWSAKWYATDTLAPFVDFVNVMTYDLSGPWSSRAGHNAPMGAATGDPKPEAGLSVPAAVDYWLDTKHWPKEKLVLGIPLYGRGFRAAKWGDATKGSYARSEVSYNDVLKLVAQGWKKHEDASAGVPYLEKPDGTELISYEDANSARRKGEYARKRGLAGVFFWDVSHDFDGKTNPLVRAARAGVGA